MTQSFSELLEGIVGGEPGPPVEFPGSTKYVFWRYKRHFHHSWAPSTDGLGVSYLIKNDSMKSERGQVCRFPTLGKCYEPSSTNMPSSWILHVGRPEWLYIDCTSGLNDIVNLSPTSERFCFSSNF